MPRALKILSINFTFRFSWVAQAPTLATPLAFFDFDVVVIRPYLFHCCKPGGPWQISRDPYFRFKGEVTGKVEDTNRLLDKGGVLVVLLDVVQEFKYDTAPNRYTPGGTVYTLMNYDFLNKHFYECVRNGVGSSVEVLDTSEPFSAVLKSSKVEWTAFLGAKPPSPFDQTKFFARNGPGSFIGGHAPKEMGSVVFLPNFKELNEEQFFEACRDYRFSREGTPPPEWLKLVFLPGAREAEERIATIQKQLDEIEGIRKGAARERDELLAFRKLLYEKGKTQLEPIARKALDRLGFGTTPSETIRETGFEIDGRTTVGSIPGLLEVKGSKKQIGLDEFSPFIPKILADLGASGRQSKGILIGNGLCETVPSSRVGEKMFSPHVLEAAKSQSIALVNSVDLYCVLSGVLSGEIKDPGPIRERILTTSGFVPLVDCCRGLPFRGP
jgi:hypothetical protein